MGPLDLNTMLTYLLTFMCGGSLGALAMAIFQINHRRADDDFTGEQM